jgi:hypothetical protein
LYLEAAQVGGERVDPQLDPKSSERKEVIQRFWQLRWSELELVGDSAVRLAMVNLENEILAVQDDPGRDRANLRWRIECLADALRISMEKSWGAESQPFGCEAAPRRC